MSSSRPVTIVMGVFNGERFLAETVDSILSQSFRNFKLNVFNDDGTGSSGAIHDSYQKKDSRLRTYHQRNKRLVEPLNRGCGLAKDRYITQVGADEISVWDRLSGQDPKHVSGR